MKKSIERLVMAASALVFLVLFGAILWFCNVLIHAEVAAEMEMPSMCGEYEDSTLPLN